MISLNVVQEASPCLLNYVVLRHEKTIFITNICKRAPWLPKAVGGHAVRPSLWEPGMPTPWTSPHGLRSDAQGVLGVEGLGRNNGRNRHTSTGSARFAGLHGGGVLRRAGSPE